jgi:N-acetylneuraminic acid mutarotase
MVIMISARRSLPFIGSFFLYLLQVALVFFLSCTLFQDAEADGWATKTSMPTARFSAAAEVVDGKIYVIGGNAGTSTVTCVEMYDQATDTWETGFEPLPAQVCAFASATIGNKIYVMGGHLLTDNVYVYDTQNDTWSQLADMPAARRSMKAAVLNAHIYVFGGAGEGGANTPYYDTVYKYNPGDDSWFTLPDMPSERTNYAMDILGGKAHIIGGSSGSGDPNYIASTSNLRCDDPDAGTYTEMGPLPEHRTNAGCEVVGNSLYLIGGNSENAWRGDSSLLYSSTTNSWGTGPSLNYGRTSPASAYVDDTIYVFGGMDEMGDDLSSVESYTIPEPASLLLFFLGLLSLAGVRRFRATLANGK